ncbi:Sterol regulatory element-binding protein cleavage-activating protein [Hypsizygus marmoreus]|uniref:Sterol regulatory element-binding protein cleavage-activating protein n=1 Tax=Hypsizygus marmoreus TaxID=39966 RepID=A0A369JQN0_HYPMA|nr:Sterol regulatory element-binding protein cleavage-activating protein [Hypsizygus marmoreus]
MFDHANLILHWSRTLGQRFFLRFGLHCATHQIRIILVSCVVITSLFYPALDIYTSTQSLSILDTFKSTSTTSGFDDQKDLVNLWSSHHALRRHEDAVSRAKCGVGRALRVERLLIQGQDDEGALTRQTLLSALDLEHRLEKLISSGDTPCLKRPDGKCFVLSPLLFWNYDRDVLLSDTSILDTLSPSKNISLGGITITPEMVLAHRRSNEPHLAASRFDFAAFLAVTYFFPESDCLGNLEHTSWIESVQGALAQEPEPIVQIPVQGPRLITLEYDEDQLKINGWSALSAFTYLAYIGFFAYVVWSVGKMTAVHSRLGVTFTALVEIAVSTITSLSVCALVGFKITMVPWELLPIVIVFVGAENMFNLVDAVGKTSVTLPVKQRIAEGLSRAGTSNTLKVVSYNAILGVAAVFSVGAIRQFCAFAIVVLVAHWFLAHTFFLAVLSIDLQRLELDELLRHDPSLAPANHQVLKDNVPAKPRSIWQKLVFMTQNLLGGRAATNLSLVMLLAIMGTLYYTTYTASPLSDDQAGLSQLSAITPLRANAPEIGVNKKSHAWYIWKTLNPTQSPLLHLRIESPIIVTFRSEAEPTHPIRTMSRQRFSSRQTFRLLLWLLKIMVLPIAATTSLLWCLLLYLLKDAELLEAQRNREPDAPASQEDLKALEGQISFSTLPRAFASDVELIAASKDGNVVISIGLHNEIIIWRQDRQSHISIDAANVLLRTASTSSAVSTITSVAVDSEGRYCAVGTGAGFVAVWVLEDNGVRALPLLSLDHISAAVTELQFSSTAHKQSRNPAVVLDLLATYESGVAAKWSLEKGLPVTYIAPSHRASVVKCSLVPIHPLNRFLIAFSLNDGTLEVLDTQDNSPWVMSDFCVQAGDAIDTASKVHACEAELGGTLRRIIAVATEVGLVSLWDGSTGECISVFDDVYGRINQLRITPVQCEICHFCGQLPLESVSVAFSVDHVIRFFRLYLNDETRRCSCSRHPLRHVSSRDNLGRRSRSNSMASQAGSATVSPSIPRARLATTFEASAFPVSGHGIHSRRASEKDTGRRSLEMLTVPFPGDEYDSDTKPFINPSPSFWHDAILVRMADITCERGGWGVNGKKVVGVRRKPRAQGATQGGTRTQIKAMHTHGLTAATLDRWELWIYDPSLPQVQNSLLSALASKLEREQPCSSSLTDCVPRLPFTRVSPFLMTPTSAFAGFGNTVVVKNPCQADGVFLVTRDYKPSQKTVLVSPNGVAHYRISTSKQKNGSPLSVIQRPADSPEDSIVAEIEWRTWEMPTVVRCPLFRGIGRCIGKRGLGIAAQKFLYKRGRFSKSRYFIGNDGIEYRWKAIPGIGFLLTSSRTDEEIARYTRALNEEGLFAGEKKSVLRIQPCSVDIDLVILSFMIMEKKRRDHAGDGTRLVDHDEDPQGDGGAEGGE